MLIRIKEGCINCNTNDRNQIVDAAINPNEVGYPKAIYICKAGCTWHLDYYDYEELNLYTTEQLDNPTME